MTEQNENVNKHMKYVDMTTASSSQSKTMEGYQVNLLQMESFHVDVLTLQYGQCGLRCTSQLFFEGVQEVWQRVRPFSLQCGVQFEKTIRPKIITDVSRELIRKTFL